MAATSSMARARAVRPDFALDIENVKTVSAICARLDGLPLAIELIAARMRLMTPQVLLDRLSGQFVLTADGMRAASERQKTLNNAIDWSYNLLPLEEQKMFAYLSIFSGGFSLEAVEAIFPGKIIEKPLPTLIALLLDKSLLKLAPDAEAYAEARYTMLVTIQEYARERLQEMGEETEIRNEHLAYLLALAEKADKELRGRYQLEWLNRLNSDRDNLRAALGWAIETGQTGNALQLVRKLHGFWIILSNFNEACSGCTVFSKCLMYLPIRKSMLKSSLRWPIIYFCKWVPGMQNLIANRPFPLHAHIRINTTPPGRW